MFNNSGCDRDCAFCVKIGRKVLIEGDEGGSHMHVYVFAYVYACVRACVCIHVYILMNVQRT